MQREWCRSGNAYVKFNNSWIQANIYRVTCFQNHTARSKVILSLPWFITAIIMLVTSCLNNDFSNFSKVQVTYNKSQKCMTSNLKRQMVHQIRVWNYENTVLVYRLTRPLLLINSSTWFYYTRVKYGNPETEPQF